MKALLYFTAFSLIGFAAQADDDFCQQFPDAPVCLQASSPEKTFCQEYPDNPACAGLGHSQDENQAEPSNVVVPAEPQDQAQDQVIVQLETPVPVAPVLPSAPPAPTVPTAPAAQQRRTNIVIITDQPGAVRAHETKRLFETLAPFSCMNLVVEIMPVSSEQINCNPRTEGTNTGTGSDRLLVCDSDTRQFAEQVRRTINDDIEVPREQRKRGNFFQRLLRRNRPAQALDAEVALTIVNFNTWSGAGHNHTPLISSRVLPGGGIHEILHGVGFPDEASTESIMARVDGQIPRYMWPQIAEYFHTTIPANCN